MFGPYDEADGEGDDEADEDADVGPESDEETPSPFDSFATPDRFEIGHDEPMTPDERQARCLEIERQFQGIAEGSVVVGDPVATEGRLRRRLVRAPRPAR